MKSKREAILEAANDIFCQHGFHNAKIIDIAKTANVGKGTVYEYFNSKADLFYQMAEHSLGTYAQAVREAVEAEQTFEEKILAFVHCQRSFIKDKMDMSSYINNASIVLDEDLKVKVPQLMIKNRVKVATIMGEVLIQGQTEGKVAKDIELMFCADMVVNNIFQFNMAVTHGFEQPIQLLLDYILGGVGKR